MRLELTEKEWGLYEQEQQKIDDMMCFLASLSKEQRFQWYREHQYCYPIGFDKEIGGTVYTVTAHFNENTSEDVEKKNERILTKNQRIKALNYWAGYVILLLSCNTTISGCGKETALRKQQRQAEEKITALYARLSKEDDMTNRRKAK